MNGLNSNKMLGFETAKQTILSAHRNQKLPHAVIIDGKKGIGKASFTHQLLEEILADKNLSNLNILTIKKDADKREITIDKIRKIFDFIKQTSANSYDKFVVIDSGCELNKSSSNALLKILEEPRPNNFLILISHSINRILPTIRSRCQIIKIPDLSFSEFSEIVKNHSNNLDFLSEICENSPAIAINFGADLTRFYEIFLRSIINKKLSGELIKVITTKDFNFAIAERSIEFFVNRLIKKSQLQNFPTFFEEDAALTSLAQKFSVEKLFILTDECLKILHKTTSLNLDKKMVLTNIFNCLTYE